jgi:hypothetical protein
MLRKKGILSLLIQLSSVKKQIRAQKNSGGLFEEHAGAGFL